LTRELPREQPLVWQRECSPELQPVRECSSPLEQEPASRQAQQPELPQLSPRAQQPEW
jgi:hypothetical protein